jgi:hypothetical protein
MLRMDKTNKNKIKVNVDDTNGPISGGKYKKDRK